MSSPIKPNATDLSLSAAPLGRQRAGVLRKWDHPVTGRMQVSEATIWSDRCKCVSGTSVRPNFMTLI
jgi:hypothetical protein